MKAHVTLFSQPTAAMNHKKTRPWSFVARESSNKLQNLLSFAIHAKMSKAPENFFRGQIWAKKYGNSSSRSYLGARGEKSLKSCCRFLRAKVSKAPEKFFGGQNPAMKHAKARPCLFRIRLLKEVNFKSSCYFRRGW